MIRKCVLLSLCLSFASGCEPRLESRPAIVQSEECEYVIAVLIDLSGSFLEKMTDGGQAHQFLLFLIDRYFRERIGTNAQIIVAQISGTPDRAIVWQGTPLELRKDFSSPWAFSKFLRSKADADGSCVHSALTQTVEYLMSQPNVASGDAKSAVFVLSDMVDNGPNPRQSKDTALQALTAYRNLGGTVGLFYVDQQLVPAWRHDLEGTGLTFSVEPEFRKPKLPSFE